MDASTAADEIMQAVVRGWIPQGKVPMDNYNRILREVREVLNAMLSSRRADA